MTHSATNAPLEPSRNIESGVRLTPCPPVLKDFLFVLETLPPDCELPDLATKFAPYAMRPITAPGQPGDGTDGIAASLEAIKSYEDRVCHIDRVVDAYRVIAEHIEDLPRVFRFHLWHTEHRYLWALREDDPDYANEEDQAGLKEAMDLMIEFIESCNLVDGEIEETAAKLRAEMEADANISSDALAFNDDYLELIRAAEKEYTYIRESRLRLLKLIRRSALLTKDDSELLDRRDIRGSLEGVPARALLRTLDPVYAESTIEIDENGIAQVYAGDFGVAIDGVDVTRIRECKICSKIFWAGRKDSWCCSTGCADKRRKRQHRARYKERLAGPPTTAKPTPKVKQPLSKSGRP